MVPTAAAVLNASTLTYNTQATRQILFELHLGTKLMSSSPPRQIRWYRDVEDVV